jgi:hypothetical protein
MMENHVFAGVRREWERWKDGNCIEDSGVGGKKIIKWFLNIEDKILCAGFIWLRTGNIFGLLGVRKRMSR